MAINPKQVIEACEEMDSEERYDLAQLTILVKGLAEYVRDNL